MPEHWTFLRTKHFLREVNVRSKTGKEDLLSVSQYTGITKRKDSLRGGSGLLTNAKTLVGYKFVEAGDLVMNIMLAWRGSQAVSSHRGITSPAYSVFRVTRDVVVPEYLHYIYRTELYNGLFKTVSTGVMDSRLRLYPEVFFRLPTLLPPLEEQHLIVRYLRALDAKGKRYIRTKRKLIAALQEQRQAIIQRAVTRGLNPNVKLKPSGVEWLGEVPEHWEVVQIRRIASFVTSGSRGWAAYYSDTGDIFLQSGNLGRSMELNMAYTQHVKPPAGSEGIRTRVQRNDVLVCITGALTGNVAIVDRDFPVPAYVNQHVALLRLRQTLVYPRFLTFVLHSELGRVQFKTSENGGTKQGLGLDDVKAAAIPLPPIDEQVAICKATDEECKRFTDAIVRAEAEIKVMHEYHTRLIADVVTGAVDVREAAGKLPEEDQMIGRSEDQMVEEEPLSMAAEGEAEYGNSKE